MPLRILLVSLGVLGLLTACGGRKDNKFNQQFGNELCDAYTECRPDVECDPGNGDDEETADCDFDKSAAKECLDGPFTCMDEFGEGYEYIAVPDVCGTVYTDCP